VQGLRPCNPDPCKAASGSSEAASPFHSGMNLLDGRTDRRSRPKCSVSVPGSIDSDRDHFFGGFAGSGFFGGLLSRPGPEGL